MGMMTSCQNQTTIVNGLDQNEANEILVFLSSKGIDANKVVSAGKTGTGASATALWDIAVNTEQVTEAMSLLNQAGLPRRRGQNLLGIFSNVGLVPSDLEQKIRYEAGLAETIASTIRKIDGVLDANVQISFPQEDPLNPGQYKGKITASVYVKHSGVLDDPNSHLISKIKRLVASSITGLDYDNVTVIPDRARYSEIQPGAGVVGEEEKQYVNVWSIILAKDSVTKFRILFFCGSDTTFNTFSGMDHVEALSPFKQTWGIKRIDAYTPYSSRSEKNGARGRSRKGEKIRRAPAFR